jgi:hypothetical protein
MAKALFVGDLCRAFLTNSDDRTNEFGNLEYGVAFDLNSKDIWSGQPACLKMRSA